MSTDDSLSIGSAAALYGLTPATLRWWEKQGVIPRPDRRGGRRRYGEADLRRIGLAYLCCITGRMPLSSAAVVTSGKSRIDQWQNTVSDQIGRLDDQIAQLQAARAYLRHMLHCTDDDMADCPYLDDELTTHTPWRRDEIPPGDDEFDPTRCAVCATLLSRSPRGRPPTYCSQTCRQRAYRSRRTPTRRSGRR
ncbi:MerR family transcriptional regulator [Nocardia transvalensis]|nr:MerR family transcriptional regulator [Nocardia transvalensis]MBF6329874.1 MerR family transcriptional regulator [Nocardia transvalensis]